MIVIIIIFPYAEKPLEKLDILREVLARRQVELFQKHRELRLQEAYSGAARYQRLLPVETRGRMINLYMHAIASNFKPEPGQILGLVDEIPKSIAPFKLYSLPG